MTVDQFRDIRAKAGGLIILLPDNLSRLSAEQRQVCPMCSCSAIIGFEIDTNKHHFDWPNPIRAAKLRKAIRRLHSKRELGQFWWFFPIFSSHSQHIYALEQAMLSQEISIPVYFSKYNNELEGVIDDISNIKSDGQQRDTALAELVATVSANGYQVSVSGAHHAANKQSKIPIVQGELFPVLKPKTSNGATGGGDASSNNELPLIVITAHLDNFGLVNDHLTNVDAAVLLTLIDTFSKIHNSVGMAPKYRMLFLLTESGTLLNFQGAKKWLDTNIDENAALQNAEFVVCLDSIGKASEDHTLYMHVSKPPKEGTHMNAFYKQLKQNAQRYANATVEGVHKKINLADVQLAWEHERFSMKRMPAFTVSALKSHKDALRSTIFETSREQTLAVAERNAKILAETLANYIYGGAKSTEGSAAANSEIFSGSTVSEDQLIFAIWTIWNDLKMIFDSDGCRQSLSNRLNRGFSCVRRWSITTLKMHSKSIWKMWKSLTTNPMYESRISCFTMVKMALSTFTSKLSPV